MTDEDAARALWGDLKAGDADQWVLGFRMSQGARKPVDEFVEAFVGDVEALLDQRGADPGQAESMARQIWAIARDEANVNRARRLRGVCCFGDIHVTRRLQSPSCGA